MTWRLTISWWEGGVKAKAKVETKAKLKVEAKTCGHARGVRFAAPVKQACGCDSVRVLNMCATVAATRWLVLRVLQPSQRGTRTTVAECGA